MPLYNVDEPRELIDFTSETPLATWNELKANSDVNNSVKRAAFIKTGGLCIYCEHKLIPKLDYQIEHFHPKLGNDNSEFGDGVPNRAIEWLNLFPGCLGGTARKSDFTSEVDHLERTGANKKNKSALTCGQRKKDKPVENNFISPELLSNDRSIFKFNGSDGSISVDEQACEALGVDVELAGKHTQELNLDSKRLRGIREKFSSILESEFNKAFEFDPSDIETLIKEWLALDDQGVHQHPFYSLIVSKYS